MGIKKTEDIALGNRIKDIRAGLQMDQKTFSLKIGCTVSALSNWENGRNKPNDIMLRKIAKLGNVTVTYLLTGEQSSKTRILENIKSLSTSLKKQNDSINQIQSKIDKLNEERKQIPSISFDNSYLSDLLLLMEPPSTSLEELYDGKIDELIEDKNMEISIRNEIKRSLDIANLTLKQLEDGKIFSIQDRHNPEFDQNGISQQQISENLKTIPYLLNYESTMKVLEFVDALLKNEENRFNP